MNSDRKKRRPAKIELEEGAGQLTITWQDGRISHFSLEALRRACPCAQCKERRQPPPLPQPGQLVLLDGAAATATAALRRIDRVGHYALRLTWADGHDYGIYPFEMLRGLDEG